MKQAQSNVYIHSESVVKSVVLKKYHPINKKDASKRHKFYSIQYFSRLKQHFGTKFLFFLTNSYLSLKGSSRTILYAVPLKHFDWLGLDSQMRTVNSLFLKIPWSIKGLIGAISDTFALFGYNKSSWMFIYTALSCLAALFLGVFPRSVLRINTILYLLYFFAMMSSSALDLLCEGKYTQIMIDYPDTRGDIVSFIWFIQSLGGCIVGLTIGPVLDAFGAVPMFYVLFVLNFQLLIFITLNFVDEKPCATHLKNVFDKEKLRTMGPYFTIAIVCGIAIISSTVIGLFGNPLTILLYNLFVAVFIQSLSYLLLPIKIAHVNLFIMLTEGLYPNFREPLENWYTNSEKCVPNGPHFNQTYFQTVNIGVGGLAKVFSIIIYQAYMSHWKLRTLYWVSAVLCAIANLNDFIIMHRWNKTVLGIPDNAMYLIGDGIVAEIVFMLNFLPPCILLSRVCPKNIESTAYAILAAYSNYGGVVSSSVGLYLQKRLNINFKGDNCSYDALPVAILIGSCVMYPLSIPISWWLIPPYRASDPSKLEDIELSSSFYNRFKKWRANRQEKKERLELTLYTSPVLE